MLIFFPLPRLIPGGYIGGCTTLSKARWSSSTWLWPPCRRPAWSPAHLLDRNARSVGPKAHRCFHVSWGGSSSWLVLQYWLGVRIYQKKTGLMHQNQHSCGESAHNCSVARLKNILPTVDTSGCSSLRRLGYQTNAHGLKSIFWPFDHGTWVHMWLVVPFSHHSTGNTGIRIPMGSQLFPPDPLDFSKNPQLLGWAKNIVR